MFVFVSWACQNKWPEAWWFKTTGLCHLTVLETRYPSQGVCKATLLLQNGRILSCPYQLLVAPDIHWFVAAWLQFLSSLSLQGLLSVCTSFSISYKFRLMDLGTTLSQYALFLIFMLIVSTETLFLNKVPLWDSRQTQIGRRAHFNSLQSCGMFPFSHYIVAALTYPLHSLPRASVCPLFSSWSICIPEICMVSFLPVSLNITPSERLCLPLAQEITQVTCYSITFVLFSLL